MGVKGLWELLQRASVDGTMENLRFRTLGVDVSLWMHQVVKGCRNRDGAPLPNAHILGLLSRICNLIYFDVKAVFVFDGPPPALKLRTLAGRREHREKQEAIANRATKRLIANHLKAEMVGVSPPASRTSTAKRKDMFELAEIATVVQDEGHDWASDDDDDDNDERERHQFVFVDTTAIDVASKEFNDLPLEIQHDIILDMKDRLKRKDHGVFDTKPSGFSNQQITGVMIRSKLTRKLEEVREGLLRHQAVIDGYTAHKVVSEDNTLFILERRIPTSDSPELSNARSFKPQFEETTQTKKDNVLTTKPNSEVVDEREKDELDDEEDSLSFASGNIADIAEFEETFPPQQPSKPLPPEQPEQKELEVVSSPVEVSSPVVRTPSPPAEEQQVHEIQDLDSDTESLISVKLYQGSESVDQEIVMQAEEEMIQPSSQPFSEIHSNDIIIKSESEEHVDSSYPVDDVQEEEEVVVLEHPVAKIEESPAMNVDLVREAVISERESLIDAANRAARASSEITPEMLADVQELLRLFGIPFVVSESEAEAQCAFLESIDLIDGTITDDNDIFLFGGKRVFRHVCSKKRSIEMYTAQDLQKTLGISRDQLIELAMLLGCDYTEGITGVGIVSALEIMADFPGTRGLEEFKSWLHTLEEGLGVYEGESKIRRHIRALKNPLLLPPYFPDDNIRKAFLSPQVDQSQAPFSWQPPDFDKLSLFLAQKLAWDPARTDAYFKPIREKLAIKRSQRPLETFFSALPKPISSRPNKTRLDIAVLKVAKNQSVKIQETEIEEAEDKVEATSSNINEGPIAQAESAFSIWFQSIREILLASFVDYSEKDLDREAKNIWAGMTPSDKAPFFQEASKNLAEKLHSTTIKKFASSCQICLSNSFNRAKSKAPEEVPKRKNPRKKQPALTADFLENDDADDDFVGKKPLQSSSEVSEQPKAKRSKPSDESPAVKQEQDDNEGNGPIFVNRAPVLTLWVAIVASRRGYSWETAVTLGRSICNKFAEAKGRRLGLKDQKETQVPARIRVDQAKIMKESLSVVWTKDGMRACDEMNQAIQSSNVIKYLQTAFKGCYSRVYQAMSDLAGCYPDPNELDLQSYELYKRFRPQVDDGARGWGAKAVLDLEKILALRPTTSSTSTS